MNQLNHYCQKGKDTNGNRGTRSFQNQSKAQRCSEMKIILEYILLQQCTNVSFFSLLLSVS